MEEAISGIRAGAVRLAVSAHNVANVNTEGYKAYRAINYEQATGGGTGVYTQRTEEPTDLANEMIEQTLALRYVQANGEVFKTGARMHGELVNLLA